MYTQNLFTLARGFLAQVSDRGLISEQLDTFERECITRKNKAMADYRAGVTALRRTPEYLMQKTARNRGQQELTIVVPVLRMIRVMRQHLAQGRRVDAQRIAMFLLSKATRTAPTTLMQGIPAQTRFGYDKTYFTGKCVTAVQANRATLLLNSHPELFGPVPAGLISSKPLMSALCRLYDNEDKLLKKLHAHLHRSSVHQQLAGFVGRDHFDYPNVLESKRIVKSDALQFTVTQGANGPEAFFGLCRHPLTEWTRELTFPASFRTTGVNPDVAGAWDESSFGIRVRGEKLVAALKELHEAALAGKVVFGGTFLAARKGQRLSGVVLANESLFTEADRQQVEKAQAEYESGLRLKCLDDSRELMRELYKMQPTLNLGFLWARWRDAQESAIGYFLNPGYGLKADYGGPYTREQLVDWVKSGCSYQLKRQEA